MGVSVYIAAEGFDGDSSLLWGLGGLYIIR